MSRIAIREGGDQINGPSFRRRRNDLSVTFPLRDAEEALPEFGIIALTQACVGWSAVSLVAPGVQSSVEFGEERGMTDLLLADEREAVASASRHLAQAGLVIGTAGNVSARHGDLIAVTPTGSDLAKVTAEMVTVIDLHGAVVDGDLAPTSEVPLHTGIYAATNALAVAHAHAMASTALSCCFDELPAVHYSCLVLGGSPRTAPYATFGSQELAENVIEALNGRNAAMMQNHGSVAYGRTMDEAVERLELLEWLAELYWRASSLGTPHLLTNEDFEHIFEAARQRYGATRKVDDG